MKFIYRFILLIMLVGSASSAEAQDNDSINELMFRYVSYGNYEDATDLILNQGANVNYIDTIEIVTGGSSPSFKPPSGGGFFGALASILVLPFVVLGAALGSVLSSNRGSYYEISTLLEKTIEVKKIPGKYEFIELLLEQGANVNQDGKGFEYPLNKAIVVGDTAIVNLLVEHGADLELAGKKSPVLDQAISANNETLAIMFLENGESPNLVVSGTTAMNIATKKGMLRFVEKASEKGYSLSKQKEARVSPYIVAMKNSDQDMVDFIKSVGANAFTDMRADYGNVFTLTAYEDDFTLYNELEEIALLYPNLMEESEYESGSALANAMRYENYTYALWLLEHDVFISKQLKEEILASEQLEIMKKVATTSEEKLMVATLEFDRTILALDYLEIRAFIEMGVQPKPEQFVKVYEWNNTLAMKEMLVSEDLMEALQDNDSLSFYTYGDISDDEEEAFTLLIASGISPETPDLVSIALDHSTFKYLRILMDHGCDIDKFSEDWDYQYGDLDPFFEEYTEAYKSLPRFHPSYLNGQWYFENESGSNQFDQLYDKVHPFQLRNAAVRQNNEWFLIDLNGKKTSNAYDSISLFQYRYMDHESALAMVKNGGKYNFINRSGQEVFDLWFDESVPFENVYIEGLHNLTSYSFSGNYGVLSDDGKIMSLPKYKGITSVFYRDGKSNAVGLDKKDKEKLVKVKQVKTEKLNKYLSKLSL